MQCGLIMYGFRLLRLGTAQRREEVRQQHTAPRCALEALIERTAPQSSYIPSREGKRKPTTLSDHVSGSRIQTGRSRWLWSTRHTSMWSSRSTENTKWGSRFSGQARRPGTSNS